MKKETFTGLPKGTLCVVVKNSNNHNYPLDKPLIMSKNGLGEFMQNIAEGIDGNTLRAQDCEFLIDYDSIKVFREDYILRNSRTHEELEVIGYAGQVVFYKTKDGDVEFETHNDLYDDGWRFNRIKGQKNVVVELSVAEVAKRLGVDPALLKIVDKC